jgi:uncharacterized protein YneF (UPF0154 family)
MEWQYIVSIVVDLLIIVFAIWIGYNWGYRKGLKRRLESSPPENKDIT